MAEESHLRKEQVQGVTRARVVQVGERPAYQAALGVGIMDALPLEEAEKADGDGPAVGSMVRR